MTKRKNLPGVEKWIDAGGWITAGTTLFTMLIPELFESMARERLYRLGDKDFMEMVLGSLFAKGMICATILSLIGWLSLQTAKKFPALAIRLLLLFAFLYLVLLAHIVWQDFPHPSTRADLLSEVVMTLIFAFIQTPVFGYIIESIQNRLYNQQFYLMAFGYGVVYFFIWPAMIGDMITICMMGRR